jgi:hypothetical protein
MTMLPIQVQVLTMWFAARDRIVRSAVELGDDERGELTGGVILLVALAVVAAAVALIIVGKIEDEANRIP